MKSLTLVGVLALAFTCVSCGGYGSNSSGSPGSTSVAGNWQFTYTSSHGGTATVSGPLTQTGSSVSGNVTLSGSCGTTGTFSGTLNGLSLTGTITENTPETITITGSVAGSYGSSTGTYQVTVATGACISAMGDTGTWTGARTSAPSGGYGGLILPADRLPVGLVVALTNNGGELSGTATFSNSACLHSVKVTGTVSGLNLELRDTGMGSSVVMTGTMDEAGKTLALTSNVSGVCSGESGTGTLTKMQ